MPVSTREPEAMGPVSVFVPNGVASPKFEEGQKFGGPKCLILGEYHYFA